MLDLTVSQTPQTNPARLEIAQDYFQSITTAQAAELDRCPKTLSIALETMGDLGLLGMRIPSIWGGAELSPSDFQRFRLQAARYSGALAFLQTQHQSAGAFLVASTNEALKQAYLPHMTRGQKRMGIGFSHLRRSGPPLVQATPISGGYQVTGVVPWVTGWDLFDDFVLGATLPSGEAIYGVMPLRTHYSQSSGGLICSAPMTLGAMAATNTVQVKLQQYFWPSDRILFTRSPTAIHDSDRRNVLHHSFMALGCAQAGLDCLAVTYEQKALPFLPGIQETLQSEWSHCCKTLFAALTAKASAFASNLAYRAEAINLMQRCVQAAITAASGAANLQDHPAQRIYREALCFTVSGQTSAVMEASLAQLHQRQLHQHY